MDHAVTVRIDTRNDLLKRKVSFLKQKMKEEMDLAWEDFFEKNPGKKEEDVWRWVEERLRSKTKFEGSGQGSLRPRSNKSIKFRKTVNLQGNKAHFRKGSQE
jgi:hypothetical protein